ncbi:MAG: hypothetical protein ABEJ27_01770 [Halodesulfurarchaeum sp.]
MVALGSLPVFIAVVVIVTGGLFVTHRRTALRSAVVAAIGAGIVSVYVILAIVLDMLQIV